MTCEVCCSHPQPPVSESQAPHQEVCLPIAAVGGAIHVQDSASWLVNVGHLQGRHGPHDVEVLQQTMLKTKSCHRFSWSPSHNPDGLRALPGFSRGYWHIACAILVSKIGSHRNCLREIDMRVVGHLTGATPLEASVIEAMANSQHVFLRPGLGV